MLYTLFPGHVVNGEKMPEQYRPPPAVTDEKQMLGLVAVAAQRLKPRKNW
jgi:hypothetical protein